MRDVDTYEAVAMLTDMCRRMGCAMIDRAELRVPADVFDRLRRHFMAADPERVAGGSIALHMFEVDLVIKPEDPRD